MLTKKELEIYRNELISENHIGLRYIKLLEPMVVLNKRFTTGLIAKRTKSIKTPHWTDQWMALSDQFSGRCLCGACGKFIFADTTDFECIKLATAYHQTGIIPNCTPEHLQIQGAHIILTKDIRYDNYILAKKGSTFITPLCKECNHQSRRILRINYGTLVTPEIR